MASPFVFDSVARILGFKLGAMSSAELYLKKTRLYGGEEEKKMGAHHENTIYWGFIEKEIYLQEWFVNLLIMAALFLNVFYFFIRRGMLWKCI